MFFADFNDAIMITCTCKRDALSEAVLIGASLIPHGTARRFARLARPVKEVTGGITGWADEGFSFAANEESGRVGDMPV